MCERMIEGHVHTVSQSMVERKRWQMNAQLVFDSHHWKLIHRKSEKMKWLREPEPT